MTCEMCFIGYSHVQEKRFYLIFFVAFVCIAKRRLYRVIGVCDRSCDSPPLDLGGW
jgi:hypothetical protein